MMKKFLIFVAILAITINANAQEKQVIYGIKAGFNLSQISTPSEKLNIEASDLSAGFFVSGHANYSFGKILGLQWEWSFSMQGGKGKLILEEEIEHSAAKFSFHYINIPVLLEVKPITNFSIFTGAQIGFIMYKGVSCMEKKIYGVDFEKAIETKFNPMDVAAVIGLQYAIEKKYLISARYNFGLTPIFDVEGVNGLANRVFQMGIGYQF